MTSKERHEARYQRRVAKRQQRKAEAIKDGDTLEKLLEWNNFEDAYKDCRKGVSWKHSVQNYGIHLYENISRTLKRIKKKLKITKGFVEFDINERGKQRHIKSVHISERVVQKLCCKNVLTKAIDRTLIYDNSASTKGKGTHFCIRRLSIHLQRFYRQNGYSNEGYIATLDIKGFFDSIKHIEIFNKLKGMFDDKRIVEFIMQFVDAFNPLFANRKSKKRLTKLEKFKKRLKGLSLGLGSEVSQTFAKSYTNIIDHFMKEILHLKFFGHYMDDFWIIAKSKEYLEKVIAIFEAKLKEIGLALNKKKCKITKLRDTFTFLKVRFNLLESGKVLKRPGRKSITRMRRKLKKMKVMLDNHLIDFDTIRTCYESWKGHMKGKSSRKTVYNMNKLYNELFIDNWHCEYYEQQVA